MRGRGAHAVAHRGLIIAGAFLHRSVEIVVARIAALHRRFHIGHGERVPVAQVRDAKRPAGAVEFVGAAFVVFRLAEIGQHVVKAPAGITELPPEIKVLRLAADIDQAVDRARAAENFSARRNHIAVVAFGLRDGLVAPIVAAIAEQPAEAERDMQPWMHIAGARLQQQHAMAARRSEPIGEHAAGAAGPHDDEVEAFRIRHAFSSLAAVRDRFLPRRHWIAVAARWKRYHRRRTCTKCEEPRTRSGAPMRVTPALAYSP